MSDREAIEHHVQYMTDEELDWTLEADQYELALAASENSDRLTDDNKPLNPWWYHPWT